MLPNYQEVIIPGGNHLSVLFDSDFEDAIEGFLLEHSPKAP